MIMIIRNSSILTNILNIIRSKVEVFIVENIFHKDGDQTSGGLFQTHEEQRNHGYCNLFYIY